VIVHSLYALAPGGDEGNMELTKKNEYSHRSEQGLEAYIGGDWPTALKVLSVRATTTHHPLPPLSHPLSASLCLSLSPTPPLSLALSLSPSLCLPLPLSVRARGTIVLSHPNATRCRV
jgi:hypothetical protein